MAEQEMSPLVGQRESQSGLRHAAAEAPREHEDGPVGHGPRGSITLAEDQLWGLLDPVGPRQALQDGAQRWLVALPRLRRWHPHR